MLVVVAGIVLSDPELRQILISEQISTLEQSKVELWKDSTSREPCLIRN